MSDSNPNIKVKREPNSDHSPLKMSSSKSPDDLKPAKPLHTVKPKKDGDKVKRESSIPPKKDLHVKREPESQVEVSETSPRVVKPKKEVQQSSSIKKEANVVKKGKSSEGQGKVKLAKKDDPVISTGKGPSSKDNPKKKKLTKEEAEKKEKKVYSLPGQKHDPPDERDPLRIFYESLYEQNPNSEMAENWMMEHGLLSLDVATKAFERKKKNQLSQKIGSPVKQSKDVTVKAVKVSSKTVIVKSEKKSTASNGEINLSPKVKRKLDSDDDDDFILKPKKKSKTKAE